MKLQIDTDIQARGLRASGSGIRLIARGDYGGAAAKARAGVHEGSGERAELP